MRRLAAAAASLTLAVGFARVAVADDSSFGVMLPGWQSNPPGAVQVQAAFISLNGVEARVSLELGPSGMPARLKLNGPRFGWLGEGEPYPDRQFPELAVSLGGSPLKLESGFRAYADGRDVTTLLSQARLDPFAVALSPPYLEPGDPPTATLDVLGRAGAVRKGDTGYLASWTTERTVAVTLPAGPGGTLATTYRARPAFGYLPTRDNPAPLRLGSYCLDARGLAVALGQPTNPGALVAREYAISAAVDGRAPVSVTLAVGATAAGEGSRLLVAACGTDGKVVLGKATFARASVRASSDGIVHVLTVEQASPAD
jgi:hypothetical protein